jgi:hypothetical protein
LLLFGLAGVFVFFFFFSFLVTMMWSLAILVGVVAGAVMAAGAGFPVDDSVPHEVVWHPAGQRAKLALEQFEVRACSFFFSSIIDGCRREQPEPTVVTSADRETYDCYIPLTSETDPVCLRALVRLRGLTPTFLRSRCRRKPHTAASQVPPPNCFSSYMWKALVFAVSSRTGATSSALARTFCCLLLCFFCRPARSIHFNTLAATSGNTTRQRTSKYRAEAT